jgi:PKD domain/Secretion system C-terminal sorting domain
MIQYDLDKNYNIKKVDTLFKGSCCDYTGKTTDTVGFYPQVVLCIDGRMYYKSSYQNTFGCINFPNKQGKASKVMPLAHNFYPCYSWLPYFPNYRLGPIDGSSCDTLGINNNCKAAFRWDRDSTLRVEFTDLSYYEPQKWKWDFGDGTMSTDTSPIHIYARSGTYRVCLTVMNANGMDTYCTDVNIINTATETPSYSDHHIVKVYPNPASDFVLIEHEQVHGLCKLKLYDALGIEVHAQYLNIMDSSTIIPLDKLASGMYYYTLTLDLSHTQFVDGDVQVLDSGKIVVVR